MTLKVEDLFNGTAGIDVSSHAPGFDFIGGGWTDSGANTVELDGIGGLKFSAVTDGVWIDIGVTDQILDHNLNAGGADNRFQITTRRDNTVYATRTCYEFNFRTGDGTAPLKIFKTVAGTNTELASSSTPLLSNTTTYNIQPEVIGSSLDWILDGTSELSTTDASITTGTYVGGYHALYTNGNLRLYDFKASDTVTGTNIDATKQSLLLTEQTANVNAAVNITTNVDALSLTSYAADINLDVSISTTVQSLILTEYTADINLDLNIATNVDALTLTTFPAVVNIEKNISTNLQSLILTEYAASITAGTNIDAGVDALILTTYAATINAAKNITTNLQSLVLTEYPAAIGISTNITTGTPDALILTEYPASIFTGISQVNATVQNLSITTYPFELAAAKNIIVNAPQELILTTYPVTISFIASFDLIVDEATHALFSDQVTLSSGFDYKETPFSRTIGIEYEDRMYIIEKENKAC